MKEHCVIDGERCSDCCKVLTINEGKNFRAWQKWVRRYGLGDNKNNVLYKMTRKISKRRAKKINSSLVKTVNNNQSYFTCKNYDGEKCTMYENRPDTCSSYPLYGHDEKTWSKWLHDTDNIIGLYRDDCTYYDKSFYEEKTA
jgi:Fe-S-cluster containining protein